MAWLRGLAAGTWAEDVDPFVLLVVAALVLLAGVSVGFLAAGAMRG
jgi:hypothetical protein